MHGHVSLCTKEIPFPGQRVLFPSPAFTDVFAS